MVTRGKSVGHFRSHNGTYPGESNRDIAVSVILSKAEYSVYWQVQRVAVWLWNSVP